MSAFRFALMLGLAALACSGLERGRALSADASGDPGDVVEVAREAVDDVADAPGHPDAFPEIDATRDPDGDVETLPAPCDDGDPCTVDQGTDAAACRHWAAPDGGACGAGLQCLAGACLAPCLDGPCPAGLELFDGCRCRVPPSGVAADRCLTDHGLTPCETVAQGSPYYGQDAHVDGRSLHFHFANPWTTAATPPPDHVADLRTGLRWTFLQDERTLAEAEAACSPVGDTPARLPTLDEALTLLDLGAGRCPWLDPRMTATCPSGPFRVWTGTALPWDVTRRFVLTPSGPSSAPVDVAGVICLLDGTGAEPVAAASPDRLVDLPDGTVLDRASGLQWQRHPACTGCSWSEALGACRGQSGDWHLATARELWTLLRTDHLPPLVEARFTEDLQVNPYADGAWWTSTPWVLQDDPTPRSLALDVRSGTTGPAATEDQHPALCVRRAPVGPSRFEPEARANAATLGDQRTTPGRPALAALQADGFVAVWLDAPTPGSDERVLARRFDARGRPRDGSELALSTSEPGHASEPTVAVDGQGAVLVGWVQEAQGKPSTVSLRALDASGQPSGEVQRIASVVGASCRRPTLAGLPAGGFVVAFDEACDPGLPPLGCKAVADLGAEVNLVRVSATGQLLAEPLPLPQQRAGDQAQSTLTALPDGRVFGAWLDLSSTPPRLWTRVVDPATGEGTADTAVGQTSGVLEHPAAFALASTVILTWDHRKTASARVRAHASQLRHSGEAILTSVFVSYTPLNQGPVPSTDQRFPQGSAGPDDTFAIVYDIDGGSDYPYSPNDHDGWAVAVQSFTEWVFHNGPPRRENAFTRGAQTGGSIVGLPDGQQVVLFTSDGGSGTGLDVWFRRSEAACRDQVDNDGDGAVDDADPDCYGHPWP